MSNGWEKRFISQSVSLQVYSPFQSEFSTEFDLVLPHSFSCILSFPQGHPVASHVLLPRLPVTSIRPSIFQTGFTLKCL